MRVTVIEPQDDPFRTMVSLMDGVRVRQTIGRAATELTRGHLYAYGQKNPGKHSSEPGYTSTRFYETAANNTSYVEQPPDTVDVNIASAGIGLRRWGGVVTPKSSKYLTLPAIAEAHGKRAREFGNLEFGLRLDPDLGVIRPALVEKVEVRQVKKGQRKRKGERTFEEKYSVDGQERSRTLAISGGRVMFWLCKSTTHTGDEAVLPTRDDYMAAIRTALTALFDNSRLFEQ